MARRTGNAIRGTARGGPVRAAGGLYLIIILAGMTSEAVLRAPFHASTAAATAAALAGQMPRFRLSLAADLGMMLADVALAVVFYLLLRPVAAGLALAAMVFRLVQAAMIGASLILLAAVPGLLASGEGGLAAGVLAAHATGYDLGLVFFGVNGFLMARLLILSGGVPKAIAWAIAAAGVVYVAGGVVRLLAPGLSPALQPAYLLPLLAESAFCLWLLIRARI